MNLRGSRLRPIHRDSVLEAGGKPSTRFPPEGLVELTRNTRGSPMPSYDFLMKKLKNSKISKNLENLALLSSEALLLYELSEREPG